MNDRKEWQIEYLGFDEDFNTDEKKLKFLLKKSYYEKIIVMVLFSKILIDDNPEIFKDNAVVKYALLFIKDAIQKNYLSDKINKNERTANIQIDSRHVSILNDYSSKNLEEFFKMGQEENLYFYDEE